MNWTSETLNRVYDKTGGYCRYCEKRVYWKNYGMPGERGAWEIDHSVPVASGGSDNLRNLWPSCVECNRDKGTMKGSQYLRLFEEPDDDPSLGELVVTGLVALALIALLSNARGNARP